MTPHSKPSASRLDAIRQRLGHQLATRLFNDIARHQLDVRGGRRPRVSPGAAAAYAAATLVHATSICFAVVGLVLLFGPGGLWTVFAGVVMLLLAWLSIPRRAAPPSGLLDRADFPALHDMADRLSTAMQAPRPDGIAISKRFGASYRICGFRGRRYVELGLPLLAVLTPRERAAVLAHELSHGANGDPLRGQFLFGAVDAVGQWGVALRPLSIGSSGDGMPFGPIISIIAIPFELALLALSECLLLVAGGMHLLVLRDSQRAEYLADLLAGSVTGPEHLRSALEKTYLAETIEAVIRHHALTGATDSLLKKLKQAIDEVPASRIAVLREQSRQSGWRVDTTHPPTALRIDMLTQHGGMDAHAKQVAGDPEDLEAEILKLAPSIERELVDHYLVGIHG
jgi:Zn-dependent protease with chaperone function